MLASCLNCKTLAELEAFSQGNGFSCPRCGASSCSLDSQQSRINNDRKAKCSICGGALELLARSETETLLFGCRRCGDLVVFPSPNKPARLEQSRAANRNGLRVSKLQLAQNLAVYATTWEGKHGPVLVLSAHPLTSPEDLLRPMAREAILTRNK